MEDWQKKYILNRQQGQGALAGQTPQQPINQIDSSGYLKPLTTPLPKKPSNTCSIRAGALLYRPINQEFGNTAILVVPVGPAPQDFTLKQFEYKESNKTCYLVENQSAVIDMGKLDQNEQKTLSLIEVSSPFVGRFLVHESNIVYNLEYVKDSDKRSILRG